MPNGWPETETTNMIMASRLSLQDVPSSFDWREKGNHALHTNRETDEQTNGHIDRQTNRQTERQSDS